MYGKKKGKKDFPPTAGAVWNGKSKKGLRYIRVSLNTKVLEKIEADDEGRISLVGFQTDSDKEGFPDYFLQESQPMEGGKGKGGGGKKRRDEDEDEDDAAEADDDSDAEDDEDESLF